MIIEIDGTKKTAKKNYRDGLWREWTKEHIKGAFNFGNGTMSDLIEYAKRNKMYCILYDTEKREFLA